MKRISMLLVIVLAILMWFSPAIRFANSAVSDCEIPTSCTLVDSKGNNTSYQLAVYNVNEETTCPGGSGTCYQWTYTLTGSSGQVVLLAPNCCDSMGYQVPAGGLVTPPGQGDPLTKFGNWSGYEYSIRMAPSGGGYVFLTDKVAGSRSTAMQLKVGSSVYYCKKIQGPDCPLPPQAPNVREITMILEGDYIKLSIDQFRCVTNLFKCDTDFLNCKQQTPVEVTATTSDGTITNMSVSEVGGMSGNEICPWGKISVTGSPGCTLIPAGNGRFYKVGTTCRCITSTECAPPTICKSTGYCGQP